MSELKEYVLFQEKNRKEVLEVDEKDKFIYYSKGRIENTNMVEIKVSFQGT